MPSRRAADPLVMALIATIYVVAEAEVEKAIDILKIALAQPSYEYDDLY